MAFEDNNVQKTRTRVAVGKSVELSVALGTLVSIATISVGIILGLAGAYLTVSAYPQLFRSLQFNDVIGCAYRVGGACQTMYQSEAQVKGLAFLPNTSCSALDFCTSRASLLISGNSTPDTDESCKAKLGAGASACPSNGTGGCCPGGYECETCGGPWPIAETSYCVPAGEACGPGQMYCGGEIFKVGSNCNLSICCNNPPYNVCGKVKLQIDGRDVDTPVCGINIIYSQCPEELPNDCGVTKVVGDTGIVRVCCSADEQCYKKTDKDGDIVSISCTTTSQLCFGPGNRVCTGTGQFSNFSVCCHNGNECGLAKAPGDSQYPVCVPVKCLAPNSLQSGTLQSGTCAASQTCPVSAPQECPGLSSPGGTTVCCGAFQSCFPLGGITPECSNCEGGSVCNNGEASWCCPGGSLCGDGGPGDKCRKIIKTPDYP